MTDYNDEDRCYDARSEQRDRIEKRLATARKLDEPVEPPGPTLREAQIEARKEFVNLLESDEVAGTTIISRENLQNGWIISRMKQILDLQLCKNEADLLDEYPPQKKTGD